MSATPKTANADIWWCQGFSEPGSGSDLASLRTRAERNAQGWLLNGQKIWTTNAHHCHYMIALVRTSGQVGDRHQGLSQLIVDLKRPGVTVRPIRDMSGDSHFCEVFFDQVQLDAQALIGVEGQGWEQVTAELAYERSGPERLYSSLVLFDQWLDFVRQPGQANDTARQLAGQIIAQLAPLRAMTLAVTEKLTRGQSPVVEAALLALPVGTVFTVTHGTGITIGDTFTLTGTFSGGAGHFSANAIYAGGGTVPNFANIGQCEAS